MEAQEPEIQPGSLIENSKPDYVLLIEATGRALECVTSGDAEGWFVHCEYPVGIKVPLGA